jgi:hypothetical protein
MQFSLNGVAQTHCDSMYAKPDTFYIAQASDTAIKIAFVYEGNEDLSYAPLSFYFPDSSLMQIKDGAVTPGISGPMEYSFHKGYRLTYNQPNIPPNTQVDAYFRVTKWLFSSQQPLECDLPVTFVINSPVGKEKLPLAEHPSLFPNPANEQLVVQSSNKQGFDRIRLYDKLGKFYIVHEHTSSTAMIDLSGLAAGTYFLVLEQNNMTITRKVVKQ